MKMNQLRVCYPFTGKTKPAIGANDRHRKIYPSLAPLYRSFAGKKLEELGIGRPSTYAPTISTIIKREYVEKRDKEGVARNYRLLTLKNEQIAKATLTENTGAEKAKLFPTDLGLVVTDFLKQYFDDIMDYGFTARIENEFDDVAEGKLQWNKMIDDFYSPFKEDVDKTIETAERIKGERELGTDPKAANLLLPAWAGLALWCR